MAGPYCLVVDGVMTAAGALPTQARRLSDNVLVTNLQNLTAAEQEACGWFLVDVLSNPRPADTPTNTWSSGWVLVNGRPVEQWTSVVYTTKQLADMARDAKRATLTSQVQTAYTRLQQIVAYVPPTITGANAVAQLQLTMSAVQDMAKMMQAMLRMEFQGSYLDATAD